MNGRPKRLAALAALPFVAGLLGCQPRYDGLQIRFLFGEGQHAHDRLEVAEGQAVLISVDPRSSNPYEDYEAFDLVTLESVNEGIMFIAPATEVDEFVVTGVAQGTAFINISINGEHVDDLEGAVVQPVPSP